MGNIWAFCSYNINQCDNLIETQFLSLNPCKKLICPEVRPEVRPDFFTDIMVITESTIFESLSS